MMLVLGTGPIAGCMHVISGPDHLAALAPIALDGKGKAVRLGALWGLGHGLAVSLLAGLGLVTKQFVDIQIISLWSEFLVGLVLVGVGLWSIRRAAQLVVHSHDHGHEPHDGHAHLHLHLHVGAAHDAATRQSHSHAVLGVGFLHGAAGTGHLFGVIPALALPPTLALLYVVAYLFAVVGSMALFGGMLGRIATFGGQRTMRALMLGSGTAAIGVGVFWAVSGWPV